MKMKRIYNLLSLALVFLTGACNYLDIKPSGQVIPSQESEFRAVLTSAYNAFPLYKDLLAVRADEIFPYPGEYGRYDDYIGHALWNEQSDRVSREYPWRIFYKTIFYANSVLDGVDEAGLDAHKDTREQLKGEAFLLRAYAHFELLNLFAVPYNATTAPTDRGIPLALKIDIEQKYIPVSVEAVYTQILSDISAGAELLTVEEQPEDFRYRFSKKAARAFEARVRLYRSEWNLALETAEALLPGELENLNDANATLPYSYTSKEAIMSWEKIADGETTRGDMFMMPNIMDKFDKENDARVALYFKLSGDDYLPAKGNNDAMKVTFRSGEIYLIAAEAAAHMEGKLPVAKDYLKQLMANRLTPAYYQQKAREIDGMNQEELLEEIMDERARELALEGHRWYDLRRTTRPEMIKVYIDQNGNEQRAVLQNNDPRYTLRFPKEATESNPDLNEL